MGKDKIAVVDGANVAYEERSEGGDPKVENIIHMCQALENMGYDPIVIIDATLRYQVDDPQQLESLISDQTIRQAPADTEADYFVLQVAEQYDAPVISNDRFEKYEDRFPWIYDRRVPFMIVNGKVQIYEPKLNA